MNPPIYWGEYNALYYVIYKGAKNPVEVYRAGNAPGDSQGYIAADRGVGLRVMRSYCIITAKAMAAENGGEYRGVSRMEDDAD